MAKKNKMHYSGIGGQAVLEGVMMKNGEKYEVSLQISVHHALVDGMPLARAFEAIQEKINEFSERSAAL